MSVWSSEPPKVEGWYWMRWRGTVTAEEVLALDLEYPDWPEGAEWSAPVPSPEEIAAIGIVVRQAEHDHKWGMASDGMKDALRELEEALEKCDRALDLRKQLERYLGAGEHATLDPWTVVQAENAARAALRKLEEARDE